MRLGRAAVVAAVAGGLGTVAHVSAGGLLPNAAWLGIAAVLLTWAAWTCLAGPASTVRVVSLVGGGQMFVHLLLTATAGHAGDHAAGRAVAPAAPSLGAVDRMGTLATSSAAGQPRRGSLFDLTMGSASGPRTWAASDADALAVPHWAIHIGHDLTGPHMLMAAAHLVAAAGVAWWLAMGEHALWLLLCFVGVAVLAATIVVVCLLVPPVRTSSRPVLRRHRWGLVPPVPPPLVGATARRGPPAPAI